MAVQKIPPPPFLAGTQEPGSASSQQDTERLQRLNRWLLEIQNILNSGGLIEPDQVDGLPAVIAQVGANTFAIALLQFSVFDLQSRMTVVEAQTAANTANIAAAQATITTLQARNQVLNGVGVPGAGVGNNGDLYINNTGAAGSFLYGKIGGAWTAFA